MSEEEKIKQFEEEQLNKLLIELRDINNFKGFENGAFKYNLGKYQADLLLEHINQLQNEHNILTEFEKWLEKKKKKLDTSNDFDRYARLIIIECLDKLQELKGDKNEP